MNSTVKPSLVDTYVISGQRRYDVNINVVYDNGLYHWDQIQIPVGKFDYSGVVDSLITFVYPNDKMQAIVNNYLLDPNDSTAVGEFNKMQNWRKTAKELAKEILTYEVY